MENFRTGHENKEKYSSKIALIFTRHGEKESDKSKSDEEIELTSAGKKQAVDKSKSRNVKQSLVYGSKRIRSQETAALIMAGGEDIIIGDENIEELKQKLNKEFKVGASKIGVDEKLDFELSTNSDYSGPLLSAFKEGRFMDFLVNESDELAKQTGQQNSFNYSKAAADVAGIVKKYIKISSRWDELVRDDNNKYTDTLERFFGSHQGVLESFLLKVIEKTKGIDERDELVKILGSGFDFTEGFKVEILSNNNDEPIVHIQYKKDEDNKTVFEFNESMQVDLIDEIIKDYKG